MLALVGYVGLWMAGGGGHAKDRKNLRAAVGMPGKYPARVSASLNCTLPSSERFSSTERDPLVCPVRSRALCDGGELKGIISV